MDQQTGTPVPRRSRVLARVMDDAIRVPGTQVGLGLDAVIGLVPGVGDLAGSAISGVVLYDAVRCHVPVPVLARMGGNLVVDALLGVVPLVGDAADVAHRANRKNIRLMERALADRPVGAPVPAPTVGYVASALLLVAVPLLLALVLGVVALVLLVGLLI